jgi:SPX domain protein involved in polyphosphate accumulation
MCLIKTLYIYIIFHININVYNRHGQKRNYNNVIEQERKTQGNNTQGHDHHINCLHTC